jgi:hypothetical protein
MIIALLMLIGYFLHSSRQRYPIINMQLFRIRTFQVSIMGNIFARLGFGGVPFLLPLLLQVGLGYTAQLSGFLLVPIALGVLLVKAISLPIMRFLGYKRLLLINTFLVGLSLWAFKIINAQTPIYVIAGLTFLFGFLISLQYSGMNSLAYAEISTRDQSAATSIVSTMQQLAQSLGVAMSALLLRYYSSTSSKFVLTPDVFHQTFFAMGLLTFLSTFIFIRLKHDDGYQMLTIPAQEKAVIH